MRCWQLAARRLRAGSLVFRPTNRIWEYRRRIGFGARRRERQSAGWRFVSLGHLCPASSERFIRNRGGLAVEATSKFALTACILAELRTFTVSL